MPRVLLLIALLAPFLGAGEPPEPRIFFRTPDAEAKRRIDDGVRDLNSSTRTVRSGARRDLSAYGPWSVPALRATLDRQKKDPRVRMNAVLALARIETPGSLAAILLAAESDPDPSVREAALLALGVFGDTRGAPHILRLALTDEKLKPEPRAAAAFALARTRRDDAVVYLAPPPPAAHPAFRAGVLLAECLVNPQAAPQARLDDASDLVRAAAATGCMLRPPAAPEPILQRLRQERDTQVRTLLVYALAAMLPHTEAREALREIAARDSEKREARVAALTGLSWESGVAENAKPIRRLIQPQNDKVVAAAAFALARTRDPEGIRTLLGLVRTGSPYLQFYAYGSLLHVALLPPEEIPEAAAIREAGEALRASSKDALQELARLAASGKRGDEAREAFRALGDPIAGLDLWSLDRQERVWRILNDLLPVILNLDDLTDRGVGQEPPKSPVDGSPQGPEPGRARSATPEEQDLLDFLAERPYFAKEDLRAR